MPALYRTFAPPSPSSIPSVQIIERSYVHHPVLIRALRLSFNFFGLQSFHYIYLLTQLRKATSTIHLIFFPRRPGRVSRLGFTRYPGYLIDWIATSVDNLNAHGGIICESTQRSHACGAYLGALMNLPNDSLQDAPLLRH